MEVHLFILLRKILKNYHLHPINVSCLLISSHWVNWTPLESSIDELEDCLDPLTYDPEVLDRLHQENMKLQPGKSLSDTRPVWSYIEGLCDGHEDMASGTSILPIKTYRNIHSGKTIRSCWCSIPLHHIYLLWQAPQKWELWPQCPIWSGGHWRVSSCPAPRPVWSSRW